MRRTGTRHSGRYQGGPEAGQGGEDEEVNYFATIADLLAGILFVMLIMLMSFAIVHYKGPGALTVDIAPHPAQATPAANRRMERQIAVVRERADLLKAIQAELTTLGITSQIDIEDGYLRFDDGVFFDAGSTQLSRLGAFHIQTVSDVVRHRIACFLPGAACATPGLNVIDGLFLDVSATPTETPAAPSTLNVPKVFAAVRALSLLNAAVGRQPEFVGRRTVAGQPLLSAAGFEADPANHGAHIGLGFAMSPADPNGPASVSVQERAPGR